MSDPYEAIACAREYVDDGWDGEGWKPSELLTVGYCALATGPHPETARPFLDRLLDEARDRFREGYCANPFGDRRRRAGA